MLYEVINAEDKKKLSSLIDEDYLSMEINALLVGHHPCRIFVDDIHNIQTALIYSSSMEGFYLVGNEKSSRFQDLFRPALDKTIIPELKEKGYHAFEFSCSHEAWTSVFPVLFGNRELDFGMQNIYSFKPSKRGHVSNVVPETVSICEIDKDLLSSGMGNIDYLSSKIELFWNSVELFLDRGVGFCLVDSNEIAGICISGFVYKDRHSPDIETLPHHQRKGYANALVNQYLNTLSENNQVVSWECMDTNIASKCLAEKCGFRLKEQYKLYFFDI